MCRELVVAAGRWRSDDFCSERVSGRVSGVQGCKHQAADCVARQARTDAIKLHTGLDGEWLEDAPAACSASSMNSFTLLPTNIHVSLRLQHKHSH